MLSNNIQNFYNVVVIGAGHAGLEALYSAAKICKKHGLETDKVCLITLKQENIGEMSCNPAFGGIGKGAIVREIDAMDGLMGRAADMAGIHFKMLNQKKGPAVWGPRCQADRKLYKKAANKILSEFDNIDYIFESCEDIKMLEKEKVVVLKSGREIKCNAVVLTTGTFLAGQILRGEERIPGGRINEEPSNGLSNALKRYGFEMGRLKTGTPTRLNKETIDWSILPKQYGDTDPIPFSYLHQKQSGYSYFDTNQDDFDDLQKKSLSNNDDDLGDNSIDGMAFDQVDPQINDLIKNNIYGDGFVFNKQICCYVSHTSVKTKNIILENKHRSPVFQGVVSTLGPRYCPSIEDKTRRFANDSHRVFLEPEGLDSDLIYPNGLSTSMPKDVQDQFMSTLKGCDNVKIMQYGYVIEYDFINPIELNHTLETKRVDGLFLAGQINGTTGYEEAGGQGLIAGINAALKACNLNKKFITGREESYIGVMIDDLIFKGAKEPYRMFTSRCEYRLSIRADNADLRLTQRAIELNLCSEKRINVFYNKLKNITKLKSILTSNEFTPNEIKNLDESMIVSLDGVKRNGFELLANKNYNLQKLQKLISLKSKIENPFKEFTDEVKWAVYIEAKYSNYLDLSLIHISQGIVYIEAKYSNYLDRQKQDIDFLRKEGAIEIPQDLDYSLIKSVSNEIKDILKRTKPTKISDLYQIQGITPASIVAIIIFLKERSK